MWYVVQGQQAREGAFAETSLVLDPLKLVVVVSWHNYQVLAGPLGLCHSKKKKGYVLLVFNQRVILLCLQRLAPPLSLIQGIQYCLFQY